MKSSPMDLIYNVPSTSQRGDAVGVRLGCRLGDHPPAEEKKKLVSVWLAEIAVCQRAHATAVGEDIGPQDRQGEEEQSRRIREESA